MVDTFTQTDFEAALDRISPGAWQSVGLDDGEYVYDIPSHAVFIRIRSSVDASGVSAGAGEDSIRVFVLDEDGEPWGSKAARWVTRQPGWEDRLRTLVTRLLDLIRKADACPGCGVGTRPFKVRKEGPNKGRWFLRCPNAACHRPLFEWLD